MQNEVVVLTFPNGKNYHYFWPMNRPKYKPGQELKIKTITGNLTAFIKCYLPFNESSKATKYVNIQKVFKTPFKVSEEKIEEQKHQEDVFNTFINNAPPKGEPTMSKLNQIKSNSIDSLTETKDIVIKLQKGKAVITAVKTSLLEIDTLPKQLKTLLSINGYSDLAIGALINIAGNTFTDSKIIKKAASDANFAGSVEFSNQFTFIEKFIEDVIKKALESDQLTEVKTEE